MTTKLEDLYGSLLEQIPTATSGNEEFVFSRESLPTPPASVFTDRLRITRTFYYVDDYFRADAVWFHADRSVYRRLALLTLSVVFHQEPARVTLNLTNRRSDVKRLIVECAHPRLDDLSPGYNTLPFAFSYYPEEAEVKGVPQTDQLVRDLPCFLLTNEVEPIVTHEGWNDRDSVLGFGTDAASVSFAELLLNLSRPESSISELRMEGETYYRSIGLHSAFASLFVEPPPSDSLERP